MGRNFRGAVQHLVIVLLVGAACGVFSALLNSGSMLRGAGIGVLVAAALWVFCVLALGTSLAVKAWRRS